MKIANNIQQMENGRYTIMQIYGNEWKSVESPNVLGKRFKQSVIDGDFKGVKFDVTKTNNHSTYIIEK